MMTRIPAAATVLLLSLVALSVTAASETAPPDVSVSLKNYEFDPLKLTVPLGTKVSWVNDDGVFHTATSAWDAGAAFDFPLEDGESASWTFDTPGTFVVRCLPHSNEDGEGGWMGMIQTVTVEAASAEEPPTQNLDNSTPTLSVVGILMVLAGLAVARRP